MLQPDGWHVPPTHATPGLQVIPQPPQFSLSVLGSTQPAGQHDSEARQGGPPMQPIISLHAPATQVAPNGHGAPQPPQLFGSVEVSVQPAAQHDFAPVQTGPPLHVIAGLHALATQDAPTGHDVAQPPQLSGSLVVSLHPLVQHVCAPLQAGPPLHPIVVGLQTLATHESPATQVAPQPPQFFTSLVVSTHPAAQHACPARQAGPPLQPMATSHMPAVHVEPAAQTFPQPPQFLESVSVFASQPSGKSPSQSANPAVQLPT